MGKPINVLVVDDDAALCEMLRATFELEGIEVEEAHHVVHAEKAIAHRVPDAIVLDIGLPGVDGAFYVERLRESGHTKHIPVVAISGSEDAGIRALANGANAFVRKPLDPLRLVATVERLVGVAPFERTVSAPDEKHDGDLLRLLQIAQRQHELLADAYRQTLESLAQALESRDFGTSAHSRRVVAYATRLTLEVAPSLVDDPTLEWGFLLHDVGKIGIPDQILLKPGKLTAGERRRMEQHPEIGERLVGHVPLLQGEGINVVRSHHERWDGSGYPERRLGDDIPVSARIFAVADALDAMTDKRPYREPVSWEEAIGELVGEREKQFDPDVVDALDACGPDLRAIYRRTQIPVEVS
ncbi:MAG TPA: HD domain-containing phosphohydrolase [Gaiellaceae bacterium]|nr:HD domain-containing phosphohydrolase [Gaiellaceae bacterium]